MDGFGTGYSSLSCFRMFPFDKLKIDRSFIHHMLVNPQSPAIIRSVIGLGHGLEMPVIAKGVETEEQLVALKADGCTQVQGYLISRPDWNFRAAIGRVAPDAFEHASDIEAARTSGPRRDSQSGNGHWLFSENRQPGIVDRRQHSRS
jgi:EAL domain-containing protein (putative c-di-GMP-specific phosphodiesterase class I)